MCGRFELNKQSVQAALQIAEISPTVQEHLRFGEIFPTNSSLVLKKNENTITPVNMTSKKLIGDIMKFGYRYSAKQTVSQTKSLQTQSLILNARAETIASKWMFRHAFKQDRIVVVCSSFYEWTLQKQKMSFFEPHKTMYLAAIAIDGCFVILTKEANASIESFHHRMPVIFDAKQAEQWILDPNLSKTLWQEASPMLTHTYV